MSLGFVNLQHLAKYYGSGLISNGLGYVVFVAFVYFGSLYSLAVTASFLAAHLVGFFVHRIFVFKNNGALGRSLLVSFIAAGAAYTINILGVYYFSEVHGFSPYVVQIFMMAFVSVILYIVNSVFVHVNFR